MFYRVPAGEPDGMRYPKMCKQWWELAKPAGYRKELHYMTDYEYRFQVASLYDDTHHIQLYRAPVSTPFAQIGMVLTEQQIGALPDFRISSPHVSERFKALVEQHDDFMHAFTPERLWHENGELTGIPYYRFGVRRYVRVDIPDGMDARQLNDGKYQGYFGEQHEIRFEEKETLVAILENDALYHYLSDLPLWSILHILHIKGTGLRKPLYSWYCSEAFMEAMLNLRCILPYHLEQGYVKAIPPLN